MVLIRHHLRYGSCIHGAPEKCLRIHTPIEFSKETWVLNFLRLRGTIRSFFEEFF